MQAIILAAGMGKRLGDLTKDNTKCMIKVNGTYLIDRLLSQLDSLNLERIIFSIEPYHRAVHPWLIFSYKCQIGIGVI